MHDTDPAPHFAPLFALLERIVAQRDYDNEEIADHVVRGVRSARAAGLPPERVLAYLRKRLHQAPLAAVGDWFRGVLVDRLVGVAVEAYASDSTGPGAAAPPP